MNELVFQLHADITESVHIGVAISAEADRNAIVDAGLIRRDHIKNKGPSRAWLDGKSQTFKGVRQDLRDAFLPILNAKLREMGLLQPSL